MMTKVKLAKLLLGLTVIAGVAAAQTRPAHPIAARNLVVPQAGGFAMDRQGNPVEVTGVRVRAAITGTTARTTMDVRLHNPTGSRQEAQLVVPVPRGAVVHGFAYQGPGKEPTARLLPKEEAASTYRSIVSKLRDPALLEFIGANLVQSSVFPVPPRGDQTVHLVYEHILPVSGRRVDYVLPRSESLDYRVPWRVEVQIRSKGPVATVYSPSHELSIRRVSETEVRVAITDDARREPGPFRLSFLRSGEGLPASLFAYPDPKVGGGYFLLLAGLPPDLRHEERDGIEREVILVLDRSGSMRGEKIRQVREAALQIIGGLGEGEAFNIILYNQAPDLFSQKPLLKNAESYRAAERYLKGAGVLGGTNIHDALLEALRQKHREGTLPIVLFLTDGVPTLGNTSEAAIRDLVSTANPHRRRVYTIGVGGEVNAPLLRNLADDSRATSAFVLPGEDVEVKVARVFEQLEGPVLADTELSIRTADGRPAPGRVKELMPRRLPDLFEGERLTILGKYVGEEPLRFRLSGNFRGREKTFQLAFDLDESTTRNGFVPRLWASRKIGSLIDAIRRRGADSDRPGSGDPEIRELVDEVVRLSREFGILTEYTAFLAREGTDLSHEEEILSRANSNFENRAVRRRAGWEAVNQGVNIARQQRQTTLNRRNEYLDENLNRVRNTTVQQINDLAFYRRGRRWIDSRLATRRRLARPDRVVEFGSDAFYALAERLARQNRQGSVSLRGEIVLEVEGETVLVKN